MEQVKLFYGYINCEEDLDIFQTEINGWYKENPEITIMERKTVFDDEEFLVSIFYKVNDGVSL